MRFTIDHLIFKGDFESRQSGLLTEKVISNHGKPPWRRIGDGISATDLQNTNYEVSIEIREGSHNLKIIAVIVRVQLLTLLFARQTGRLTGNHTRLSNTHNHSRQKTSVAFVIYSKV